MDEKILTLHPEPGKNGVNISRGKYESIKKSILEILQDQESIRFKDLSVQVENRLPDFAGSVIWYVTSVKLDLEARKLIERIPGKSPQQLRLVE